MWVYDITLNGHLVGDQGDLEFETAEEARADADDYIISELAKEFNVKPRDFTVYCYKREV